MNFELTDEHRMIQQAAKDFANQHCLAGVIDRDENKLFPYQQIMELAKLGFMGMMVSTEFNGAGFDTISYILAITEISKIDASVGVCMSVNNSLVCWGLEQFGNKMQQEKYLVHLAKGIKDDELYIGAFLLSEPEAGSDALSQQTVAADKGDYYVINGVKNWITNGSTASVYILIAQTHKNKGSKGINAFIIEKNTAGIQVMPPENKLGIRASDTTSIVFTDVKIPKENRIGEDGFGFSFAMQILNGGRIGIAAQALGIAQGAYELSLKYAKQRKTFDKPIFEHQAIQFKLVDMLTQIESARLLCYKAGLDKDNKKDYAVSAAMSKLVASQAAMNVTIEAVQIHGGYGYVKEYHVERLMRDAKITQIYEGTSEIQKLLIGRSISK
ncbi:MAG: acyl-CoA dehydrogenase family protein [Sediminibacterium sp.]|nr:acyl-CoA dehydrogenase family protein [Sediminibacterium sp.]